MTTQEEKFGQAWRKNCHAMEELGIPVQRMLASMEEFGPVAAAKRVFARRRNSDGFSALAEQKHLELSLEALVLQPAYGALFTDDEANFCLDSLMQAGFYNR